MSVFVDVEFDVDVEMVLVDGCIVVRWMVFYPNFLARHPLNWYSKILKIFILIKLVLKKKY